MNMKEMKILLARNVRELRHIRKWSQKQLAKKASTSQRTISRIERPETGKKEFSPGFYVVAAIASAFNMDIPTLLMENIAHNPGLTQLPKLVKNYLSVEEQGRNSIYETSRREVRYKEINEPGIYSQVG